MRQHWVFEQGPENMPGVSHDAERIFYKRKNCRGFEAVILKSEISYEKGSILRPWLWKTKRNLGRNGNLQHAVSPLAYSLKAFIWLIGECIGKQSSTREERRIKRS
mmetsp:Transcript_30641/g.72296  ORF Transcript_30641/g.72296 Transcript_30641/m.72296 type:complete len:106 (-) Transcript_30641:488-805(-)